MSNLKSTFAALDITVGEVDDGSYVVVSNSEPCFCFVRNTRDEVESLARSTLQKYAKRFHNEDIVIELHNAAETPAPTPVVVRRRTALHPTFGFDRGFEQCVPA